MIITLEQGGGFAGSANYQILGPIDTDDVDTGDRGRVVALLDSLDFFHISDVWPDEKNMSDAGWHSFTAQDGERKRTIRWTSRQVPPAALLEARELVVKMGSWRQVARPPG